MVRSGYVLLLAIIGLNSLSCTVWAQDFPGVEQASAAASTGLHELQPLSVAQPAQSPTPAVTVASGTHVLMILTSPLHTTSGVAGTGLYLETLQPVVQDNRIVIPAHTQVQGVVEANKRPGHFGRTAEFKFRFTTLIFPNNHVTAINGGLQSIPGSRLVRIHPEDGKLKTVDQADKAVVAAIVGATGGALLGSVSRVGIGKVAGGGLGAGFGMETALLQKGDDIVLGNGTRVEMVLASAFVLEPEQAAFNARYIPPREAQPAREAALQDVSEAKAKRVHRRMAGPLLFPGVTRWH